MTISEEIGDVQSATSTVYLYVPVFNPVIVVLVPLPVVSIPPGLLVNVHVPVGKLFKTTLPVL